MVTAVVSCPPRSALGPFDSWLAKLPQPISSISLYPLHAIFGKGQEVHSLGQLDDLKIKDTGLSNSGPGGRYAILNHCPLSKRNQALIYKAPKQSQIIKKYMNELYKVGAWGRG